jgi:hypothetical protein
MKFLSAVDFNKFGSIGRITEDSEEVFIDYLIDWVNGQLLKSKNPNFVKMRQQRGAGEFYETPILIKKFTEDHLKYMDPKLYNELGFKFF